MERILNDSEKIRKAEEIYYRRNNKNINIEDREFERPKTYIGSKILLRFILIFNLIIIFFSVQNKEYIFTKEFLADLSHYNININEKFNNIINSVFLDNNELENSEIHNIIEEINENVNENIKPENDQMEKQESEDRENIEQTSSLSQMDIDSENLKNGYKFIKPIDGIVSSTFGARESKYQNVSGYHTGVDIAAETGTIIKASMEGIVTLVSNVGDYR